MSLKLFVPNTRTLALPILTANGCQQAYQHHTLSLLCAQLYDSSTPACALRAATCALLLPWTGCLNRAHPSTWRIVQRSAGALLRAGTDHCRSTLCATASTLSRSAFCNMNPHCRLLAHCVKEVSLDTEANGHPCLWVCSHLGGVMLRKHAILASCNTTPIMPQCDDSEAVSACGQTAHLRRLRMKALASVLSMVFSRWPCARSQGRPCLPPIISANSVALTL